MKNCAILQEALNEIKEMYRNMLYDISAQNPYINDNFHVS